MATITVTYTSKKDTPIDQTDAAKVFKAMRTVFDFAKATQDKEIQKKLLELVKKKDKNLGTAIFHAACKVTGHAGSGEYELKIVADGKAIATSKCWINKEATTAAKNELFKDAQGKSITSTKEEYYGGSAGQPHVHVYAGGCHLKLGAKRFNLVVDGKRHSAIDGAHAALMNHAKKDELAPWVAAALKLFGVSA